MNKLTNDLGELVDAVGAPGSQMRMLTEFPGLIDDINTDKFSLVYGDTPQDTADNIFIHLQDAYGFSSMETINLIKNTKFKEYV